MVDGSIILFQNTSCHTISYQNTLLHIMQSYFCPHSSNCRLPLIIHRNETYLRTVSSMYVHLQHMPTQLHASLFLNIESISILINAINMKTMSYFVFSCLFFFSFLIFSFILFYFSDLYAYGELSKVKKYSDNVHSARKMAIEGTYSDIVDKTKPNRLYYVFDVLLPNSLESPLLDYLKYTNY